MSISEQTIVNLYEHGAHSVDDIVAALDVPEPFVLGVLMERSPRWKAVQKMKKEGVSSLAATATERSEGAASAASGIGRGSLDEGDISDVDFLRIREQALDLALSPLTNEFNKASMLKFLWKMKRPEGSQPITINVSSINIALQRAKEIRDQRLSKAVVDI